MSKNAVLHFAMNLLQCCNPLKFFNQEKLAILEGIGLQYANQQFSDFAREFAVVAKL
jgi:hypothetical protein